MTWGASGVGEKEIDAKLKHVKNKKTLRKLPLCTIPAHQQWPPGSKYTDIDKETKLDDAFETCVV